MTRRLLIADDDPMIRHILQSMLESEGFTLAIVENGIEALDFLRRESRPVELAGILLDVIMPGMSGLEVLTQIKADHDTAHIPVVLLTGESKDDAIMSGYTSGADYYITKPFTRQQLMYGLNLALSPD